jgi:hypothetical protein
MLAYYESPLRQRSSIYFIRTWIPINSLLNCAKMRDWSCRRLEFFTGNNRSEDVFNKFFLCYQCKPKYSVLNLLEPEAVGPVKQRIPSFTVHPNWTKTSYEQKFQSGDWISMQTKEYRNTWKTMSSHSSQPAQEDKISQEIVSTCPESSPWIHRNNSSWRSWFWLSLEPDSALPTGP